MFGKIDVSKSINIIVKKEEKYDRNKMVISGLEVLKLGVKKYKLMMDALKPLIDVIKQKEEIKNISFISGISDDAVIRIDFANTCVLLAYSYTDDNFYFINDKFNEKYKKLLLDNSSLILDIFKDGINNDLFLDEEMKSTTGEFNLHLLNTESILSIGRNIYQNNYANLIYRYDLSDLVGFNWNKVKVESNLPQVLETLDEVNKEKVFRNVRFYKTKS